MATSHGIRGIGRYVDGTVRALTAAQAEWSREHLGLLIAAHQSPPAGAARVWRTSRSSFRSQDLGWLVAGVGDRLATRRSPAELWHETDPAAPLGIGDPARAIVTAYDLIPLLDDSMRARIRPHRWAVYELYLRRLRRARMIIAISETTAVNLERVLRVDRRRIEVIPPAVASLAPQALATSELPRPTATLLLFVGVPDDHKRPDLAILTLHTLRRRGHNVRLVFAGHHPENRRRILADMANRLGVAESVEFREHVSDNSLGALYRTAILLALSRHEGFGLPAVEAILSGGRVVATPTPIYEEVLGECASFAENDTADAVAAAVERTLGQPSAEEDAAALRERYSPARCAAALVAAYARAQDQR